jgi:putative acetyltransferase
VTPTPFTLRPYRVNDEDAALEVWLRTWQAAYPSIDFAERLTWWRTRWRNELVPSARVTVAEDGRGLIGFVTIDATGYLDQLVVTPDVWGSSVADALMQEAMRQSPNGISLLVNTDNARAIAFYTRQGFAVAGEDVNPVSGRPVLRMTWTPR